MSTASASSSKIERDLPLEVDAARSANKYLRSYLGNLQNFKRILIETDAKLNEMRRQWDNRKNTYYKKGPGF